MFFKLTLSFVHVSHRKQFNLTDKGGAAERLGGGGGGVSHEEIKNLEALLHLMTPGKFYLYDLKTFKS